MSETLDGALDGLFGNGGAGEHTMPATSAPAKRQSEPGPQLTGVSALAREAQEHYDRAIAAQRKGDWATYGAELQQLGELLKQMGMH